MKTPSIQFKLGKPFRCKSGFVTACNSSSNSDLLHHKKKSISKLKIELKNMYCKKQFCMPRPYETLSPACVVYWNDIEELSCELKQLEHEVSIMENDDKYLGFNSIEDRFYDV
jgi:hypothetical protein